MKEQDIFYQHFTAEDHAFIDKSLELIKRVEDSYSIEVTTFLNPHQVSILQSLANKYSLKVFVSSVYFPSERAKLILAPAYYELDREDFHLSLLEIDYPSKFHQLSHAQIMGTLLNHLGIERRIIGDILVGQGRAQLFVDKKFTQFFIDNISKIAKIPVRLKEIPLEEQLILFSESAAIDILVSSLRLDKLVAASFKLSRQAASQLIANKQVKVNYAQVDNPSFVIALADLVSVRRYGRFKVLKENGFSKSGKHKLTVEILSSK